MKYVVQIHLHPGCQDLAMEVFERRGPNRTLAVTVQHAWIDTQAHIVFVLAESNDPSLVNKAGQCWAEFGKCQVHPVIDIEQF